MNFNNFLNISEQLMPFFRILWVASLSIGFALIFIALILKRNPQRKKSPWIAGSIGLLTIISSGTQLLISLI